MENDFRFREDLLLVERYLSGDAVSLSEALSVNDKTLYRWEKGLSVPSPARMESFYSYVYRKGIRLTAIKAQLDKEEAHGRKILFHGSKEGIIGPLSLKKSREGKDFGKGFYCGENLDQAASFVSLFPSSSLCLLSLDDTRLSKAVFEVDREWMLTISLYRNQLGEEKNSPLLAALRRKVEEADILIAPIADNRMFEILGEFIDGKITDVQCQHALSATDLGKQIVLKSAKALASARILEHCYLCQAEKEDFLRRGEEIAEIGREKAKIARIRYKAQGQYLEEILS
jgi:hypothetical protein